MTARRAPDTVSAFQRRFAALADNIGAVIDGKDEAIRLTLTCLLAEGHLLLEDVPGVGKTTLAKALARSINGTARRIQFTPDLLPSDVTGVSVWNQATRAFEFRAGPIFANFALADEINRASPRTQSALLEAMEERQVTIDGVTHPLDQPFMVIATQNPIEHEGTYSLPEAQLDRFLMRIELGYPDRAASLRILDSQPAGSHVDELDAVVSAREVLKMARLTSTVHVAPSIQEYILDVAETTRAHPEIALGASPRAALAVQRAARAWAAAAGREFVLPDDVKFLAPPVLAHRIMLSPEAQLRAVTPGDAIAEVLDSTPVPRATRRR